MSAWSHTFQTQPLARLLVLQQPPARMRGLLLPRLPLQDGNGLISSSLSLGCSVAFVVAPECPGLTGHRENFIHVPGAIPCAYRDPESFIELIHPVAHVRHPGEHAIQRCVSAGFLRPDSKAASCSRKSRVSRPLRRPADLRRSRTQIRSATWQRSLILEAIRPCRAH